jgi:hypothetical protein
MLFKLFLVLVHLWPIFYDKNIITVNDTSRVIRIDASSCAVTYNCQSDDSRGAIYALREHL